jgi:SAM-dependent methyltransferase
MSDATSHVRRNQAAWDRWAAEYAGPGRDNWSSEPRWGIWQIPEAELRVLPDVAGLDVVELGCGTAYQSAWLARRGARVVALDLSPAQLATARRLQREFRLDFPLVLANAEQAPFRDASFDLAVSEYGASLWCDPYRWIPEAARLLRNGGLLVFLVNSALMTLATRDEDDVPATPRLRRPQFGLHRLQWPGHDEIEFHLSHGDWIRCLRANGFQIENLLELRPPESATTRYRFVTLPWARQWPSEEIWRATRDPMRPATMSRVGKAPSV